MAKLKGGSYVAGALTVEGAITAQTILTASGTRTITAPISLSPTVGRFPKFGATGYDLVDSIVSEAGTVVTVTGALMADALRLKVGEFSLALQSTATLTAIRTVTINTGDADRVLTLGADLAVANYKVTLSGDAAGTSTLQLPAGTTTISAITSGHVLYASAANTIAGEASLDVSRGGTGRAALAAFSLLYGGTTAMEALAPNTAAAARVLLMTGTGTEGTAPIWSTIPNEALANSSITINEQAVALGESITITAGGGGTVDHNTNRTDDTAFPVLWGTLDTPISAVYSCAAVTIISSIGRLNATSFNAISARESKMGIELFLGSALDIVDATRICTYYYKTDEKQEYLKIGFIADDTDEMLATKKHDTMDITSCIGVLLKAVQELNAKVEAQQEEIQKLRKPFWKRFS